MKHCPTCWKVAGSISNWCHWNFSLTESFCVHCGFAVNSASDRNEYRDYFLRSKGGRCVGPTTLPSSCVTVLFGSLNLLEPSGPAQASTGTALPLFLINLDKYFVAHFLFIQALQQYMFNLFIPQNMNDNFLYPVLLQFLLPHSSLQASNFCPFSNTNLT